ncbi:hypothetical protein FB451DRAFT_472840 [Mycena latifolia]|nr:hypothetical protein FB451DRAFT_472840 [Mycena latifolia]
MREESTCGNCSDDDKDVDGDGEPCQKECCSTSSGVATSDSDSKMRKGVTYRCSGVEEEEAEAEATCQQGCSSSPLKPPPFPATDNSDCAKGCCSPPLERGEATNLVNDNGAPGSTRVDNEDDDDSLCPCCIAILIQHPEAIGRTLPDAESDWTFLPKNSAHRLSATVRKCCRLFESVCAQKPCCMPPRILKKAWWSNASNPKSRFLPTTHRTT